MARKSFLRNSSDVLAKTYPAQLSFPRRQIIEALSRRESKMSPGISK